MNVLIVALDVVAPTRVADAEVLVVAPALVSGLRRWVSDEDEARRHAEQLAATFVEQLNRLGVHARGRAGDADPLLAIADALATFPADEIVIAGRPHRLHARDRLVSRMRRRFALPIRDWDSVPGHRTETPVAADDEGGRNRRSIVTPAMRASSQPSTTRGLAEAQR